MFLTCIMLYYSILVVLLNGWYYLVKSFLFFCFKKIFACEWIMTPSRDGEISWWRFSGYSRGSKNWVMSLRLSPDNNGIGQNGNALGLKSWPFDCRGYRTLWSRTALEARRHLLWNHMSSHYPRCNEEARVCIQPWQRGDSSAHINKQKWLARWFSRWVLDLESKECNFCDALGIGCLVLIIIVNYVCFKLLGG